MILALTYTFSNLRISPMNKNPNAFVLDSLLEQPEDWTFWASEPTYNLINHKSGLCLDFYGSKAKVHSPGWAKLYEFSDDDGLLIKNSIP